MQPRPRTLGTGGPFFVGHTTWGVAKPEKKQPASVRRRGRVDPCRQSVYGIVRLSPTEGVPAGGLGLDVDRGDDGEAFLDVQLAK